MSDYPVKLSTIPRSTSYLATKSSIQVDTSASENYIQDTDGAPIEFPSPFFVSLFVTTARASTS